MEKFLNRYLFIMYVFLITLLGLVPLVAPILGYIFRPLPEAHLYWLSLLMYLFIVPVEMILWSDIKDIKWLMWD